MAHYSLLRMSTLDRTARRGRRSLADPGDPGHRRAPRDVAVAVRLGRRAAARRGLGASTGLDVPLLTVAVQLGFVVGALLLAATGAADVISGRRLFLAGALLAAAANLGFAYVATALPAALLFRFLTGFALAGVYPVGMKIVTGWFRLERGFAIGVLVGALTLGSALPYLFRGIGAISGLDRQAVVAAASLAAVVGRPARGRVHEGRPVRHARAPAEPGRRPSRLRGTIRPPGQPRATWATCGSSTRCGRGSRRSSRRVSRPPGSSTRPPRASPRSWSWGPAGSAASSPAPSPIASGGRP